MSVPGQALQLYYVRVLTPLAFVAVITHPRVMKATKIIKYSPTVSMDSLPILKDILLKGIKMLVLLLTVIYVEDN